MLILNVSSIRHALKLYFFYLGQNLKYQLKKVLVTNSLFFYLFNNLCNRGEANKWIIKPKNR